jgi:two-component system NarL family sensor kinase
MSAARLARAEDSGTAIALALERERRRVADELHDTAIQQLVLARILIDRTGEDGAADELDRVRQLLDDALEQLRSLVLGLTPAVLYRDGLCPAIEWLCKQLGMRWRLDCGCRVAGDPVTLPNAITETLFQGARELMTNVGRHAQARTCEVVLRYGDDRVELTVRDDGIGIEPRRAAGADHGDDGGFGLLSLRARIEELGGELQLHRVREGGTRAVLRLPLPEPPPETR